MLAVSFEALSEEEEAAVRSLSAIEEMIKLGPAAERVAAKTELIDGLREQRGPKPAGAASYEVNRTGGSAATYLLGWHSMGVMKIGWAVDPEARASALSEPLAPSLTDEKWQVALTKSWPEETLAFLMEQAFIDALDRVGVQRSGEYFRPTIERKVIEDRLWTEAMIAAQEAYRRQKTAAA